MARNRGYWNRYSVFAPAPPVTRSYYSTYVTQPRVDVLRSFVRTLEDRRTFDPMGSFRPAAATSRYARSLDVPEGRKFSPLVGFQAPEKVAVCVRRKIRKEVIIAKGGSGSGKRKRRTWFSSVKC